MAEITLTVDLSATRRGLILMRLRSGISTRDVRLVQLGEAAARWAVLSDEIEAVRAAGSLFRCGRVEIREGFDHSYNFDQSDRTPCWKTTYEVTGSSYSREPEYVKRRHRDPMCAECARWVDIREHVQTLTRERGAILGAMRRLGRQVARG